MDLTYIQGESSNLGISLESGIHKILLDIGIVEYIHPTKQ